MVAVAFAAVASCAGGRSTRANAVPVEPIAGILDAFRTHEIVALDEGMHGNAQGHALRLALIRDPRFARTVNDVPPTALQEVWQHTTQQSGLWNLPIYEAFFRAVRDVNTARPVTEQIRVLLGDPPLDWTQAHGEQSDQWRHAMEERDRFPADLIRREVLARHRRALVILVVRSRPDYPVRKTTLNRQGDESDVRALTPAERMAMVWPLSVQAWRFKEPTAEEARLRRHVVRVVRGRR